MEHVKARLFIQADMILRFAHLPLQICFPDGDKDACLRADRRNGGFHQPEMGDCGRIERTAHHDNARLICRSHTAHLLRFLDNGSAYVSLHWI